MGAVRTWFPLGLCAFVTHGRQVRPRLCRVQVRTVIHRSSWCCKGLWIVAVDFRERPLNPGMTTSSAQVSLFDPRSPFSRADARAAGIPIRDLLSPAYQRIFFDTYLCSTVPATTQVRALAALKRTGSADAYVSHHTAAKLWGIPVPKDGRIHISAERDEGRNRCRGVVTHRPIISVGPIQIRNGVRLSSPEQVFCELAGTGVGLVDLVVAGDAMLKSKRASRKSLTVAVDRMTGSGVRLARRALRYVRPGVDSPMESRLRMLLVLAGFPEPQVRVILREFDGEWGRRFDLCYEALKLIIEYDGEQHGELEHRDADQDRREELERQGYKIVTVTSLGIYRDPAKTLRRVADAMRAMGGTPPARWNPEWRHHFPGRS